MIQYIYFHSENVLIQKMVLILRGLDCVMFFFSSLKCPDDTLMIKNLALSIVVLCIKVSHHFLNLAMAFSLLVLFFYKGVKSDRCIINDLLNIIIYCTSMSLMTVSPI